MAYSVINVYGSTACSVRTRAAVALAIQATLEGKKVLLAEDVSNQLRLLLPGRLIADGAVDLFTVNNVTENSLIVACADEITEDMLQPYLADRDLLILVRSSVNGSTDNAVLVGGYDGMLLSDTESLTDKLPNAKVIAAVPDQVTHTFEKIKAKAIGKVSVFADQSVELPLFNYTSITTPSEDGHEELWQGCSQLLSGLDYSKKKTVKVEIDQQAIDNALDSDGRSITNHDDIALEIEPSELNAEAVDTSPVATLDTAIEGSTTEIQTVVDEYEKTSQVATEALDQAQLQNQQEQIANLQMRDALEQSQAQNQATREAAIAEEAQAMEVKVAELNVLEAQRARETTDNAIERKKRIEEAEKLRDEQKKPRLSKKKKASSNKNKKNKKLKKKALNKQKNNE